MAIIIGVIILATVLATCKGVGEKASITDLMFDTTTNVAVYSASDFPVITPFMEDIDLGYYFFSQVWAERNYIHLTDTWWYGIEISPYQLTNGSDVSGSSVRFTVRTSYLDSTISAQARGIISCGFPDAGNLDTVYVATYENATIIQVFLLTQYRL